MDSLSLHYINFFFNLGFQFVYRIVVGSSKRAKEEICIAELRASEATREHRSRELQAPLPEDTRVPPPCHAPRPRPLSVQLEQNSLIFRNLVMPLASGKRFFDGEFEISFCLCFICGEGRVSGSPSRSWAERLWGRGLQGCPRHGHFLGVRGAVALVQQLCWY